MNAYSLLIGIGASLAILRVVQNVPRWQAQRWANAGLLALLFALIGARLFYVLIHWGYFHSHLLEIVFLWSGGLFWPGAVLGGLASILVVAARWGTTPLRISDSLAPMVPPLVIAGWLGCWQSGIAYGLPAPVGAFWGVPSQDEVGVIALRFPLQILAAILMLVYAFFLDVRRPRLENEGKHSAWMLFGLGLNVMLFMPLRADPAPSWWGVSVHVWMAILFFAASLAFLLWEIFGFRERTQAEAKQKGVQNE